MLRFLKKQIQNEARRVSKEEIERLKRDFEIAKEIDRIMSLMARDIFLAKVKKTDKLLCDTGNSSKK